MADDASGLQATTDFQDLQAKALKVLRSEAAAGQVANCNVGDPSWNINNWGDFYDGSFRNQADED